MRVNVNIPLEAHPEVNRKRFIDLSRAVNEIEFGSPQKKNVNIQGFWVDITTPGVADTEFTITHNLGYIPTGILTVAVDKAAIIYASRKNQWTPTQMFLKCNVATVSLQGFAI